MNIKKKMLRLLSCIITICLTVTVLSQLTDVMERKTSVQKYADFWSQEADYDVLFMGTSHVINGVFPMELWNDYGIVSYNFGGHNSQVATTYWIMENALEKTTPQVVVIDCFAVEGNYKCSDIFSYVHTSLDTFPLNITKVKTILDLVDDPVLDEAIANGTARKSNEPRTKIGLLWDFSVYHSRWNEIEKNDFKPSPQYEKGADSRIAVTRGNFDKISSDEKMITESTGEKYLRMMIEDCQDRGIDVVLTYLPFSASEEEQKTANYIYDIAAEYNVDYINFLDIGLIDYQTDLCDISHLNPSGARKVSDYLGNYLMANHNVPDQRNNIDYEEWYTDYDEYLGMKNDNLIKQSNIIEYLMLLAGDDIEIVMDIHNKDLFKNVWILSLFANIGIDTEQLSEETDFIIIKNRGKDVAIINNFRNDGSIQVKKFGEVGIFYEQDGTYHDGELGYYKLYIDGRAYLVGNLNDDTSLQIDVYRGKNKIDSVKFVYIIDSETTDINTLAINR